MFNSFGADVDISGWVRLQGGIKKSPCCSYWFAALRSKDSTGKQREKIYSASKELT